MQQTTTKTLELRFHAPLNKKKYTITIQNPKEVDRDQLEATLAAVVESQALRLDGASIEAIDARYITKVIDGFVSE